MKIHTRNIEHYSILTFVLSALVFVQVVFCLSHNLSILEISSWKATPYFHYVIFAIAVFSIYALYTVRRYSDKLLLLFLILVTLQSFFMLTISFSKIILIFNFLFLVFAFYFFVSWEVETGKACFNPNFSKNDIEKDNRFPIKGYVLTGESETDIYPITVTNLNEDSCFVLFESNEKLNEVIAHLQSNSSFVKLKTIFSDVGFETQGQVITSYDRGIGLIFKTDTNNKLNWSELYKVCLERGIA